MLGFASYLFGVGRQGDIYLVGYASQQVLARCIFSACYWSSLL